MPTYEISCRCFDCKREHPIHMRIHLDNGPDRKMSVADSFPEGALPPQLLAIRGRTVLCLKTGKKVKVESNDQFFPIPTLF